MRSHATLTKYHKHVRGAIASIKSNAIECHIFFYRKFLTHKMKKKTILTQIKSIYESERF